MNKKSNDIRDLMAAKKNGTTVEHEAYLRHLAENPKINLLDQIKYSSEVAKKAGQPKFKFKNTSKMRTNKSL